jgi:hypothetical protein
MVLPFATRTAVHRENRAFIDIRWFSGRQEDSATGQVARRHLAATSAIPATNRRNRGGLLPIVPVRRKQLWTA